MAVAFSIAANWGNFTTPATSSAFSVTAGSNQYLVVYGGARNTTLPNKPTISSTAGLTWTELTSTSHNVSNPRIHGVVWIADVSAGFTSQTITISCSTAESPCAGVATLVTDITGAHATNRTSGTSAVGDPSLTLATIDTGNAVWCAAYAAIGGASDPFTTWPTGYTKGVDFVASTGVQLAAGWDDASPGTSLAFVGPGTNSIAFAVELVAVEHYSQPLAVPTNKAIFSGQPNATSSAISHAATPNSVMFVVACTARGSNAPTKPVISNSGTPLTWVELADNTGPASGSTRVRMTVWYADVSAGLSSQTVTLTGQAAPAPADISQGLISIWTDVDTSFLSNYAFGINTTGDPAVTLAALSDSNNAVLAAANIYGATSCTGPTGYTSLADDSFGSLFQHWYDVASPATSLTWTSTGTNSIGFALELRSVPHTFVAPTSGTGASSKTGTTLVAGPLNTTIPAGDLCVVTVASDNTGTTDATGQDDIVSVTDNAGNTYTFVAGIRNGQTGAGLGAHASIWYSKLTSSLVSGTGTITVTNTTSAKARSCYVAQYGLPTGAILSVAGSATAVADGGTDPVVTLSGLESGVEYLWVGCAADENNAAPGEVVSGGYDRLGTGAVTSGGAANTNMAVSQYCLQDIATSKSFTPAVVGDAAAVLVAFKVVTGPVAILDATETGSDTAALNGTLGSLPITGTLAVTETGSDTASLNGTLGPVPITGTLAVTETGFDAAALSGTVNVAGALVVTESGSDTATITGQVPIAGTLVVTEIGTDTAAFTGSVTVPIAGTLAATETGSDTAAINGAVPVSGTFAATETGTDTAVISGTVRVAGTLAVTEIGSDTAAISGTVNVAGTLAVTEVGTDTAALSGAVAVAGTIAAVEVGADNAAFSGTVPISGILDATEIGSDTAVFAGGAQATIGGVLDVTETGSDTAALTGELGLLGIAADLAAQEVGSDTASLSGTVSISGSLVVTEIGSDTAVFSGGLQASIEAILDATETGSDTAAFTGSAEEGLPSITGDLAAQETGSDTAEILGVAQQPDLNASLQAQEVGSDTASFIESVSEERDRLGTSSTRFEERRHKPRKRKPLTLTKPLTEEQVRHLKDKVHEKRRAIWERPKSEPAEAAAVVEPAVFIQSDKGELEAAKTAVAIAKARLELAELRKQRAAEIAARDTEVDIQQKNTRLKKQSENVARLKEALAEREQKVKDAELIHTRNQEAVVALLLAA